MEVKKMKGRDILIAILFGLNIVLVAFIILLLTGVVKVTDKVENSVGNTDSSKAVADDKLLTEDQALSIVKDYYSVARDFFDLGAIAYCGDTVVGESKMINNQVYSKSSQFKNKKELNSYLDNYMTSNVQSLSVGFTSNNAYIEENGYLYCTTNGKGSNMSYDKFDDSLSDYDIIEIKNDSISVNIVGAYYDVDGKDVNKKNIKLVLTKNNSDRWLISSYEDLTNY